MLYTLSERSSRIVQFSCLACLIAINTVAVAKRLKYLSGNCDAVDPLFITVDYCYLKPIGRDVVEASGRIKLLKPPVNDCSVNIVLTRRSFQHVPIVNTTVDGCQFLRNKKRNPMADLFFNILGFPTYSNINHTCPFEHDLVLEKARFNNEDIHLLPVPDGLYQIRSMWFSYGKLRFNLTLNFKIY